MTVTAARLGSAPLTLDWTNFIRIPTGAGAAHAANPDAERESLAEAWRKLHAYFDRGDVGFYRAPTDNEISQATESQKLASDLLSQNRFTDCLFLGIGGSALGPLALLNALPDRCKSGIRFHIVDNPDPTQWAHTIAGLHPQSTLVCAVTKSGTTFETMAQLLLSLEWLGRERWTTHLVAITDPEKGDLKTFAKTHNVPTLHIAPSVGGRFSIFTPVGLFPAALAGLSVSDFLLGAQQVRDHLEKCPVEKNPLFTIGNQFIRHFAKRPIHVCMPYSSQLKTVGSWFVQLWGESLGKDGRGFTPLAAVGSTDQHSILQLLRDGPDDKVTFFVTVDKVANEVEIPKPLRGLEVSRLPAFSILEGHSLQDLLRIEYRATSLVLTKRGRPHLTLQLDSLDERSIGAMFFMYSVLTAFTGVLWGVNPFDQPGVEEAKIYIREALQEERAKDSGEKFADDDQSPLARLRGDRR